MTKNINDLSTNIFYSYNKNENNTKKKVKMMLNGYFISMDI